MKSSKQYIWDVKPFLKKHLRTLILGILIFSSLLGMLIYTRKEGLSRSEIQDNLFEEFRLLFFLTLWYIILSWIFKLWKQKIQLKNMIPSLKIHFRSIISIIIGIICIIGMLIFKNLGEMASLEYLYKYDMYFEVFQLTFIALLGYIILSWLFRAWKQYRQLKNDKSEAELALLKSKIDPHFFFNTLNNLYGLAVEKSDEAPEIILKLSEIMRYTIYEGENNTVAIKDEILYLERYIEIHKIRYKKKVSITFEKDVNNEELQIPPLLFIMLLENAFKHGVESLTDDAYINLKLYIDIKKVMFEVKNNYDVDAGKEKGMGLDNLKRRLELLYPKKHQLLLNSENNIFYAQLIITLK